MAWDSKAAVASRRRQNSAASRPLTLQQKPAAPAPSAAPQPKSAHVADPFLHDFLQPGFDPAAYWNATLGKGSGGKGASAAPPPGRPLAAASATATADLAAQAQTTLSQLGAHTTRLTGVLTQLTDDILRSGSRLAYEVELLRGETIGLAEVVLQHQGSLAAQAAPKASGPERAEAGAAGAVGAVARAGAEGGDAVPPPVGGSPVDEEGAPSAEPPLSATSQPPPPSLEQLRMLAQVRARLDAVIRVFGDAMEFVMPPSALSVSASFLSVSGPDQVRGGGGPGGGPGGGGGQASVSGATANNASMEDKGQQVLRAKREEIAQLLEGAHTLADVEATAAARVDALRTLCKVWAGTAEEKARVRFVEGLQRMVEERQKELEREQERAERQQLREREKEARGGTAGGGGGGGGGSSGQGSSSTTGAAGSSSQEGASRGYAAAGYGFISQLQKIRSGL